MKKNLLSVKKSYFHSAIQLLRAMNPLYLAAFLLPFFSVECSFSS